MEAKFYLDDIIFTKSTNIDIDLKKKLMIAVDKLENSIGDNPVSIEEVVDHVMGLADDVGKSYCFDNVEISGETVRLKFILCPFTNYPLPFKVKLSMALPSRNEIMKVVDKMLSPVTESKKLAKKALKEGMGGCFYVVHESSIGFKARQGWIDEYSELTSDIDSAEQYDTLQEAVNMLYAIEDYVENFNDNQGIRATIQCVSPDGDQVLEDMAVVDIQKRWGGVDCEAVSGEQNLINCGYMVEVSESSMGYNQ